jgi:hypothetical protein
MRSLHHDRRGHGSSDGAFEGIEQGFATGEMGGFGVHGIELVIKLR